jgi:hypothetical protein
MRVLRRKAKWCSVLMVQFVDMLVENTSVEHLMSYNKGGDSEDHAGIIVLLTRLTAVVEEVLKDKEKRDLWQHNLP